MCLVIRRSAGGPRRVALALAVISVLALHLARLGPISLSLFSNNDSAIYVVLAEGLAEGHGYRLVSRLDRPVSLLYPIGYPWVLSNVVRASGTGPEGARCMQLISL